MSVVERFIEDATSCVGRRTSGEYLLQKAFRRVTVSPLTDATPVDGHVPHIVGDVALVGSQRAIYVGSDDWVLSGMRTRYVQTPYLLHKHAKFVRPKAQLAIPSIVGSEELVYWGLAFGSGRDINRVKEFCQQNGISFAHKRASLRWQKFTHEAVSKLPD